LTGPPRRLTLDELYLEIAKSAPGFAGVFRDSTGGLVIQLTNEADEARASEALAAAPEFSRLGSLPRRTARVSFDFPTLHAAARAVARSLDLAGVALIDANEARNRVVIGVVDEVGAAGVRTQLDSIALPRELFLVTVTGRATRDVSVQGRFRPIPGGVMARRTATGWCTVGVNASTELGVGFVTNSHCTYRFGNGPDLTPFYQNTFTSADSVGIEWADPDLIPYGDTCHDPDGCRMSDAAFIGYESPSLARIGYIVRTLRLRSLTQGPLYSWFLLNVPPQGQLVVGDTVNKVGATTGWTQGTITQTCVTVVWNDPDLLCQAAAMYGSDAGDSGSPVFAWNGLNPSYVDLWGIHWGQDTVTDERFFSYWMRVEIELGSVVGWLDVAY
jgi:hypothetical protein